MLNLRAALREVCPAALVRPDLLERDSRKTFERLVGWMDHDPHRLKRCHAQKRFCFRGTEDYAARSGFSHELNPDKTKGILPHRAVRQCIGHVSFVFER